DDRTATLERRANALELLWRHRQLCSEVLELGRARVGEVAQHPPPALVRRFHPRELGPADRVEEGCDLVGPEQALAAVDREDRVAARAEPAEPRELRRRPLPEAGALTRIRLLVTGLEQARQCRVDRSRQEAAIAEELFRLVERLERSIGGESARIRPL